MKITALSGSPREAGNTEAILLEVLRGAETNGAETEFLRLNDLNIGGCQACNWCKEHPDEFCAVDDDMQKVYRCIAGSDALIIGSPVYMWQMTGQTKCMIDRLYGTLMPGFSSKLKPLKLVLVFSQGAPEGAFDSYLDSTSRMFRMLGFSVEGVLTAAGTTGKGSAAEDGELMEKAFTLGRSVSV